LIVIKPDAVRRGLIGKIITRFEEKGFKILDLKMLTFTRQQAEKFYEPHLGKPFFQDLVNFITSGPVVAAILEAPNAVSVVRLMIGSTRSFEASPGTIRGDFGLGITENVIHASDSEESFKRESAIVFS
ncbi:MAG: nucleoside-diphosphate kinase, partial [Nitrososphaerales archaeon]